MKKISFILPTMLCLLLLAGKVFAEPELNLMWEELNLTPAQEQRIKELDKKWQEVRGAIKPKLYRDQDQLKHLMLNPNASDDQIREIHKHIFVQQQQLRYEALENFLAKRRVLTQKQREKLHEKFHSKFSGERHLLKNQHPTFFGR